MEFRPADLFAALRGMLRPLLLNQSVDLIFEDVDDIPAMFSDEGKISQILRNFISNALKFTERGEVRVSAKRMSGDVVFSVADTGIGIAPEDQERIFQDFAQVDHPIQRRVKGTGLGLPLSKKLAILLGGVVSVQSQLGTGAVFTVRLPLRYEQRAELSPTAESAISVAAADPASVPVLVLEDKAEMMMMYRSYLKNSGFNFVPALTIRDAQEALERLRPRVIIFDLVLRSEDSWRLLAELKQDAQTRDIPVLVASTIEDQAKAFHLGADEYLLKPVERTPLLERLRALTGSFNPFGFLSSTTGAGSIRAETAVPRIRRNGPGSIQRERRDSRGGQAQAGRDRTGSDHARHEWIRGAGRTESRRCHQRYSRGSMHVACADGFREAPVDREDIRDPEARRNGQGGQQSPR